MPLRAAVHRAALAATSIWAALLFAGTSLGADNIEYEFSGSLEIDGRWHPRLNTHPGQRAHASGFAVDPKLHLMGAGNWSFTLTPFFRYDAADSRRTHADLREAYLLMFGEAGNGEWELRLGVDRVFWGVTESQHLVDIINQTDLVEHPNKESKLGQPMAHLTWSAEWGILELFAMTYHRARIYPGRYGRLRSELVIDDENVTYESAAKEWRMDVAARFTRSLGPLDLGLSIFEGNSREPYIRPHFDAPSVVSLRHHYDKIRQFGVDAQYTLESWLFKLEAVYRKGARNLLGRKEDFAAFVIGGEYTFNSVFGSAADLGLLAEWNYDERRDRSNSEFQNDLFFAVRLGLNDAQSTEIIAGVLADSEYTTRTLRCELKRRISDRWSMKLEAILLMDVDEEDIIHDTRRDSLVALNVTYNF